MAKVVRTYWIVRAAWSFQEITPTETVPETDTGGQVEHTEAYEITMVKELGKMPP